MQNCSSARLPRTFPSAHFHFSLSRVQGRQLPTCQHSAPLLPCSHDKSALHGCLLRKTAAARAAALHTFILSRVADVPTQCTTSPLLSRQSTFASALLTSWLFATQNCSSARSRAAHFHFSSIQGRQPTCQHSAPLLPCSHDTFCEHSLYYGRVLCKDGSCRRASRVAHFHSLGRVQVQLPTCQHSAPLLPCSHDKHFSFSTPYIMVACYAKLQ